MKLKKKKKKKKRKGKRETSPKSILVSGIVIFNFVQGPKRIQQKRINKQTNHNKTSTIQEKNQQTQNNPQKDPFFLGMFSIFNFRRRHKKIELQTLRKQGYHTKKTHNPRTKPEKTHSTTPKKIPLERIIFSGKSRPISKQPREKQEKNTEPAKLVIIRKKTHRIEEEKGK